MFEDINTEQDDTIKSNDQISRSRSRSRGASRTLAPYEILHKERLLFYKTLLNARSEKNGNADLNQMIRSNTPNLNCGPHFSWRWNSRDRLNHFKSKMKTRTAAASPASGQNVHAPLINPYTVAQTAGNIQDYEDQMMNYYRKQETEQKISA